MGIIAETNRLYLSVFEDNHLDSLIDFWGDEEVMTFCNGATPRDVIPQVINGYRKCHQINGLSVYAVIEKESNDVIGAAGFNMTNTIDNIELIFHFNKRSWGRGFATEAANACIEIAKNHGNVQIITASAHPQNAGSLKILEKIGFVYKGTRWFEDTKLEEPYYEYKL